MKIRLVCTSKGFVLENDDDYEAKRLLKVGHVYEANIVHQRNTQFHRKYFQLINCAWELIGEQKQEFFHNNKNGFRKTLEVSAGHYDMLYSPERKEWLQVPKSIAFDKMNEKDFSSMYERVKDVLYTFFIDSDNRQLFEEQLKYF